MINPAQPLATDRDGVLMWRCPSCEGTYIYFDLRRLGGARPPLPMFSCDRCKGDVESVEVLDPRWNQLSPTMLVELVQRLIDRWHNPAALACRPADLEALRRERDDSLAARRRQRGWPRDPGPRAPWVPPSKPSYERPTDVPWNDELYYAVVAAPEEDEPREAYATWLHEQPVTKVPAIYGHADYAPGALVDAYWKPANLAWNVSTALRVAEMLRRDPRAEWRRLYKCPEGYADMDYWASAPLRTLDGYDDDRRWRGFVEHVAMRAGVFLECAEELYDKAPIRQLTLTYCQDHLGRLLESPHLRRLRALYLPSLRHDQRVGEWTDEDVERLAACPNLANLRYLELDDAVRLTARAYRALATSPHLRQLSVVRSNMNAYDRNGWRVTDRWQVHRRAEVEAEIGYAPCLHAYELYGWVDPKPEAVIEHPIALVPAVMARRGRPVEPYKPPPEFVRNGETDWTPDLVEQLAKGISRSEWDHHFETVPPPDSLDFTPRHVRYPFEGW